MISPTGRALYLPPALANYGVELAYRARLDALLDEMAHSLLYWIGAAYRANEPELAKLAEDGVDVGRRLDSLDDEEAGGRDAEMDEPGGWSNLAGFGPPNPAIFFALDASPSRTLLDVIRRLSARWLRRF